jgi:hypothetical protein
VVQKTSPTTKKPSNRNTQTVLVLAGTATVAILAVVLCLKYIRPPVAGTDAEKPVLTPLAPPGAGPATVNAAVIPPPPPSVETSAVPPTAQVDAHVIPPVPPARAGKPSQVRGRPLRDAAPNINFTPNYDGSQYVSVVRIENGLAAVEDKWLEAGKVEAAHNKGNEIWCFEMTVGDSGTVSSKEMNVAPQQFALLDLDDATYHGDACLEQQGGELRRSEKLRVSVCFELPAGSTPKQLVWNPPIVFASTRQPAQCNSQWLARKEIFKPSKMDNPASP